MGTYPPPGEECLEWDRRYAGEELFFGESSNGYLRARVAALFPPRTRTGADRKAALCLGEGEGRDAVFLAERGFAVTAVDGSIRGLAKLERRAAAAELEVTVVRADLADYLPPRRRFDLVTSFYCHLPPDLRRRAHARAAASLVPGGYLLLEGYTPRQLVEGLQSGGPRDPS